MFAALVADEGNFVYMWEDRFKLDCLKFSLVGRQILALNYHSFFFLLTPYCVFSLNKNSIFDLPDPGSI